MFYKCYCFLQGAEGSMSLWNKKLYKIIDKGKYDQLQGGILQLLKLDPKKLKRIPLKWLADFQKVLFYSATVF